MIIIIKPAPRFFSKWERIFVGIAPSILKTKKELFSVLSVIFAKSLLISPETAYFWYPFHAGREEQTTQNLAQKFATNNTFTR